LLINVYLRCSGSSDRLIIYDELLTDIWSWRALHPDCECIFAGDFYTNLDSSDVVAMRLAKFINDCSLVRCDDLFPSQKVDTYVNIYSVIIYCDLCVTMSLAPFNMYGILYGFFFT